MECGTGQVWGWDKCGEGMECGEGVSVGTVWDGQVWGRVKCGEGTGRDGTGGEGSGTRRSIVWWDGLIVVGWNRASGYGRLLRF